MKEFALIRSLLTGELSAVETYTQLLKRLPDSEMTLEFEQLRRSHARRARKLRAHLRRPGQADAPDAADLIEFPALSKCEMHDEGQILSTLAVAERNALNSYLSVALEAKDVIAAALLDELKTGQEETDSVVWTLSHSWTPLVKTA